MGSTIGKISGPKGKRIFLKDSHQEFSRIGEDMSQLKSIMERKGAGHMTTKSSRNTHTTGIKTVSNYRRRRIVLGQNDEKVKARPASNMGRPNRNQLE